MKEFIFGILLIERERLKGNLEGILPLNKLKKFS